MSDEYKNRLKYICDGRTNGWGYYKCDCDSTHCVVLKRKTDVKRNKIKSCGCYYRRFGTHNKKHGETNKTVENKIWKKIISLCKKDNIYLYNKWWSYELFLEDVGRRPSSKHKFRRIDTNKGFCPENCCWTDRYQENEKIFIRKKRTSFSDYHNMYACWYNMIKRCHNEEKDNYYLYGAVGIIVCDRWRFDNGFQNFCNDMGKRPSLNHTVHRINNELGYSPENCIWLSKRGQAIHRKSSRFLEYKGYNFNLSTWTEITGLGKGTIATRLDKYLFTVEEALTKPVKGSGFIPRSVEEYMQEFNDRISQLYPDMEVYQ